MKNKLIRKLMIFGLVCSTIVSTGSVTVLAAGTEAQTENTKDTEAETKVSETKEPESETKAKEPETKEPESGTEAKEPETKEPESETKAKEPETKEPESETKGTETPGAVEQLLDQPGQTERRAEAAALQISGTEGEDYTLDEASGVITIKSSKPVKISGEPGTEYAGHIIIEAEAANLTLENVCLKGTAGAVLTLREGKKLSLTVTGGNELKTEGDDTPAVRLEKETELTIGGEGKLTLGGKGTGKDISMSRGDRKEPETDENGKDKEVKKDVPATLKIKEGTITAKNGISVTGDEEQAVSVQISGGSVDLKVSASEREKIKITADGTEKVYRTKLTLEKADEQVESLTVKLDGMSYTYGNKGIYTNDEKQIFLYLPAKQTVVEVNGAEYSGAVKEDDQAELKAKGITVDPVIIPTADYGYLQNEVNNIPVSIRNYSEKEKTVSVGITGEQKGKFLLMTYGNIKVPGRTGVLAGESKEIKIQPMPGLDAGEYKAVLEVTDEEGNKTSAEVSFTVKKIKLTVDAKIDEKIYDGTKKATGTVTLGGADIAGQMEIDQNRVTFTFNSANVATAKTVTVANLAFVKEEFAKNYELPEKVEVAAKIKKAPNPHTKEELKAPSVTTVYNSARKAWLPQLTTYKGQEYLFIKGLQTSLYTKNKESENWRFGKKNTVENRLINLKGTGLEAGQTYTVWTRFAGDSNHEPSDGEVLAYSTFYVNQNGNGATDANGNKITGLTEGTTYKTGSRLAFAAVGAGMSNTSPKAGDVRYLPVSWKISEEHAWTNPPYEGVFTIPQAGSYTLQVTFKKQTYTNGTWTDSGSTSISRVNFKMAADGVNGTGYMPSSSTPVTTTGAAKTGDQSPVLPFTVIFLASGILLVYYGRKKKVKAE